MAHQPFSLACGLKNRYIRSCPNILAIVRVFTTSSQVSASQVDFPGSWTIYASTFDIRRLHSHINAETPGAIHEGGELGYALSVAFGAVMDNPDLVVACVVGDGEAETGPTATAWHGYKYIDPAESGAVLPIVHVNGFKISERTIYGTMDDKELTALFS